MYYGNREFFNRPKVEGPELDQKAAKFDLYAEAVLFQRGSWRLVLHIPSATVYRLARTSIPKIQT